LVTPFRYFGLPNVLQAIVGPVLLVYLIRTRTRPNVRAVAAISAAIILYSLILLPWTAVVWCHLGRPLEAFAVPQIGAVIMALTVPRYLSLGLVLVGLFVAESLFVYLYALHLGLAARIPSTEPGGTIFVALIGIGLLLLRDRRRELTRRYLRV